MSVPPGALVPSEHLPFTNKSEKKTPVREDNDVNAAVS